MMQLSTTTTPSLNSVCIAADQKDFNLNTIHKGPLLHKSATGCTYMAFKEGEEGSHHSNMLVVKDIEMKGKHLDTNAYKKKIISLNRELADMLHLRHKGIRDVYAFQSHKTPSEWHLKIYMEYLPGGTLRDILATCQLFPLQIVQTHVRDILLALHHLHSSNWIHKSLNGKTIGFGSDRSLKLLNVSYAQRLRDLSKDERALVQKTSRFTIETDEKKEDDLGPWIPPELGKCTTALSRKTDMWYLGCVVAEMVFGIHIFSLYETPGELLKSLYDATTAIHHNSKYGMEPHLTDIPPTLVDFFSHLFRADAKDRKSALELLEHSFICDRITNPIVHYMPQDQIVAKGGSLLAINSKHISSSMMDHNYSAQAVAVRTATPGRQTTLLPLAAPLSSFSRYQTDFEEIEFLGRGAFGDVVKVRNKLDGRYYALKRIKLDPADVTENQKILREVVTISRLHHFHVVRYYQAWVETSEGRAFN
jgi:eukaryotic translation initiation factor 2-alpha kinase 4